jgi:hypothetical protein
LENKQTEQVSQREVECYFVDFWVSSSDP